MKGIVVEINNHAAAVLSDEGCVVKVINNNYQIGQEVEIMKKQIKNKKVFAFASAAACILVMFGIGAHIYYTPYTYVSLDVNPSIEYTVNRFDRVLSVKGVNDDGTEIIEGIGLDDLENKSIEDAISSTVDEISDSGYLDSNEGGIVITTSSDDMSDAEELAQDLEDVANTSVEDNDHVAVVTAKAVGAERVAEARELGVTPGKLNLVEKMMAYADDTESIDKEEWLHKSVKDIMAKTNEYKKQNKEKEQNAGEDIQNQEQNTIEENNGETTVTDETEGQSEDSKESNSGLGSGNTKDSNPSKDSNPGLGSEPTKDSNPGKSSEPTKDSNPGKSSNPTKDSNASKDSNTDKGSGTIKDSNSSKDSNPGKSSGNTNKKSN